jgi:hypothetical protein
MKRLLLTAFACAIALAVGTGAGLASAQGGHHHRSHRAHKTRTHIRHFGPLDSTGMTGSTGSTGSTGTTGATGTTTPPLSAGTVASFTDGVLTIKLTDGTMVGGKITDETQLDCQSSTSQPGNGEGDDADENGGQGGDDQGGDQEDQGGGNGDDESQQGVGCTLTAITSGTVVFEADLRISPMGSVWESIDLAS